MNFDIEQTVLAELKAAGVRGVLGLKICSELPSRKSRAYLVELCHAAEDGPGAPARGSNHSQAVVKIYPDPGRAAREADVLARLAAAGVRVPRPFSPGTAALVRGYISGPTLSALLSASPRADDHLLASALARWLFGCHAALRRDDGATHLVGDMNLRNFICPNPSEVWGIDFGDTRPGDPLADLGEACMFILTHEPSFTSERWSFARRLVHDYGNLAGRDLSRDVVPHVVAALTLAAARRGRPALAERALTLDAAVFR